MTLQESQPSWYREASASLTLSSMSLPFHFGDVQITSSPKFDTVPAAVLTCEVSWILEWRELFLLYLYSIKIVSIISSEFHFNLSFRARCVCFCAPINRTRYDDHRMRLDTTCKVAVYSSCGLSERVLLAAATLKQPTRTAEKSQSMLLSLTSRGPVPKRLKTCYYGERRICHASHVARGELRSSNRTAWATESPDGIQNRPNSLTGDASTGGNGQSQQAVNLEPADYHDEVPWKFYMWILLLWWSIGSLWEGRHSEGAQSSLAVSDTLVWPDTHKMAWWYSKDHGVQCPLADGCKSERLGRLHAVQRHAGWINLFNGGVECCQAIGTTVYSHRRVDSQEWCSCASSVFQATSRSASFPGVHRIWPWRSWTCSFGRGTLLIMLKLSWHLFSVGLKTTQSDIKTYKPCRSICHCISLQR